MASTYNEVILSQKPGGSRNGNVWSKGWDLRDTHAKLNYMDIQFTSRITFWWYLGKTDMFCQENNNQPES